MADTETPVVADDFRALDELIDHRFDEAAAAEETAPGPEGDDEPAVTDEVDDETILDEDLDDDDELDEEDEEPGEEDPDEEEFEGDEDEDEEDEAEDEEDDSDEKDGEDVFETLSAEELEEIDNDPKLRKVYKSMQRAFTKKNQDVSSKGRQLERRETELNEFVDEVRTAPGMAGFLKHTLERHPDIVGAAFEAVATGDKAGEFLLEVGLENPDVFEEAYDRLHDLMGDETALKTHKRERKLQEREARTEEREQRLRRKNFDDDYDDLIETVESEALRLKIPKDDMKELQNRLNATVKGNVAEDGRIKIKPADAKKVVEEYHAELDRLEQRILERHGRQRVKEKREATKRKARKGKARKRQAPRGQRRKQPKEKTKFTPPDRSDPLDAYIDHRLQG